MRMWKMPSRRTLMMGAAGIATVGTLAGVGAAVGARALWRRFRMADLRGNVVLITGASRGFGFAMAQEFARLGCKLAICARTNEDLQWAADELRREGAEVLAIVCDVAGYDDAHAMVRQATQHFGRIDILVNNAGVITVGPLESQTIEDFRVAMDVMYWGVVNITLAVLPQMKARRSGRIANITSIGGRIAVPHLLPYSSAKFAAVGFSEGICAELAKDNIKVTTVVPGLMRTGSHVNATFKGDNHAEYAWFSLGASAPGASIGARRAARAVVNAVRRGSTETILSIPAQIAARVHGLAPGTTTAVLGVVNRMMPGTGATDPTRHSGTDSESTLSRSFLTKFGRDAGHELHQYPEQKLTGEGAA